MRTLSIVLSLGLVACEVELPERAELDWVAKGVSGCSSSDDPDIHQSPRLVTSCIEQDCQHLRVEVAPSSGPVSWTIDGQSVGSPSCGLEVQLKPGQRLDIGAKLEGGEYLRQIVHAMQFWSSHSSYPTIETVIIGNGEGCDLFWVVMLGGCLQGPVEFRRDLYAAGNWSGNSQQRYLKFFPTTEFVQYNQYAPWIHWYINTTGQEPLGQVVPEELDSGPDQHFSHGFGLAEGQLARVFASHDNKFEWVETMRCEEGRGLLGEPQGED